MKPEDLITGANLPDDLRAIIAELRLSPNDPVFTLVAWHWKLTERHGNNLQSFNVELKALLDLRLRALADAAARIDGFSARLDAVVAAFDRFPVGITDEAPAAIERRISPLVDRMVVAAERISAVGALIKSLEQQRLLAAVLCGFSVGLLFAFTLLA
jgi:hypothetical protein